MLFDTVKKVIKSIQHIQDIYCCHSMHIPADYDDHHLWEIDCHLD